MDAKDANDIVAEVREGIAAGRYRHGTNLPTVREWSGVSHQTVAAAYATLSALGFTRTRRGSGTVVTAGRPADAHLGTFAPPDLAAAQAWSADGGEASEETTLVQQRPAPDAMADWGITPGSEVVERTRIRYVDGVPVQHKLTVLPYDIAAARPEGYDGVPPMLAPVGAEPMRPPSGVRVADWLGWDVAHQECSITADPMDPAAAEAIGVAEGAPGFRIVNITKASDGATVYATVTTCPLHHRVTLDIVG